MLPESSAVEPLLSWTERCAESGTILCDNTSSEIRKEHKGSGGIFRQEPILCDNSGSEIRKWHEGFRGIFSLHTRVAQPLEALSMFRKLSTPESAVSSYTLFCDAHDYYNILPRNVVGAKHTLYMYSWSLAIRIPIQSLVYMLRGRADYLRNRSRFLCLNPRWLIILKHDRGYPTILAF